MDKAENYFIEETRSKVQLAIILVKFYRNLRENKLKRVIHPPIKTLYIKNSHNCLTVKLPNYKNYNTITKKLIKMSSLHLRTRNNS